MPGVICPLCGLINPERSMRCDCGWRFDSGPLASAENHRLQCHQRTERDPLSPGSPGTRDPPADFKTVLRPIRQRKCRAGMIRSSMTAVGGLNLPGGGQWVVSEGRWSFSFRWMGRRRLGLGYSKDSWRQS